MRFLLSFLLLLCLSITISCKKEENNDGGGDSVNYATLPNSYEFTCLQSQISMCQQALRNNGTDFVVYWGGNGYYWNGTGSYGLTTNVAGAIEQGSQYYLTIRGAQDDLLYAYAWGRAASSDPSDTTIAGPICDTTGCTLRSNEIVSGTFPYTKTWTVLPNMGNDNGDSIEEGEYVIEAFLVDDYDAAYSAPLYDSISYEPNEAAWDVKCVYDLTLTDASSGSTIFADLDCILL